MLGHTDLQGSRYVSLDPKTADVFIALNNTKERAPRPYVIDARWTHEDATFGPETADMLVRGFGAGQMTWRFPDVCEGEARITMAGEDEKAVPVRSDAAGRVVVALETAPINGAKIRLSCKKSKDLKS